MANAPTLFAALLLGLAASGHCLVMCGGISAALGIATSKRADGRARAELLVAYQFGRIASYALAGLLLGGVFGGFIALLDLESVRRALRALSVAALLLGALVASGRLRDPGFGIGRRVWPRLAPLGRDLPDPRHAPVPDEGRPGLDRLTGRVASPHDATCSATRRCPVPVRARAGCAAICPATRSASLPAPPISIDVNECRKSIPTKKSPGAEATAPRYCTGSPSPPISKGTSIHE